MRLWLTGGVAALLLAGCSKMPESAAVPDIAGNSAASVAFTYRYALLLPSARIADLQETHARACEALGARCRITGLSYTLGRDGSIDAGLSVEVAAPIARAFGRQGIEAATKVGATLAGAEITGTDMGDPADPGVAARGGDRAADLARIDRDLAAPRLDAATRAELLRQRAGLLDAQRAVRDAAATAAAQVARTPMAFHYATGRGTGFADRLRDAGDTALASLALTASAIAWALAALGPPALALLVALLLWRRYGRHGWARLVAFADRERAAGA